MVATKTVDVMQAFWRDKRVLVTGHTGFKGGWLVVWLERLGARVIGIGLRAHTTPSLCDLAGIEAHCDSNHCDIRDSGALTTLVRRAQPEIVFHLAAQPLVRASYHDPVTTFATNIMGTAHVLEALRGLESARVAVIVTTDKVYRVGANSWPYREDDVLGGRDPYSASKSACEIVIAAYRDSLMNSMNIAVASARAGNVIGGGDWSEDRLIPDAVRAWYTGRTLEVRRPDAIRPWQHVLEPLAGYLTLARALWNEPSLAGAFNFGPNTSEAVSVRTLVEYARRAFGQGAVRYGNGREGPHESEVLMLEISKARTLLGVSPRLSLAEAVERTMTWYRSQQEGADALQLCATEIESYEGLL